MSTLLRQADDKFDRVNEQQTRQVINTRVGDEESKTQRKTTSRGGLSLYQGTITLANGANNNVSLDYATYIYITGPTGAFSISGIKNGEKGAFIVLRNNTAQQMTITHEGASSSANNRIWTPNAADLVLGASTKGSTTFLQYDTNNNRWMVVAAWSGALASWVSITRAAGFDTFAATPTVANLMALLTDEAANLGTFLTTPTVANLMTLLTDEAAGLGNFLTTPSSSNLATLVTDETGTAGNLVFSNAPTLTNPVVGTQSALDGSTKAASTAYVDNATREKLTGARTYYVGAALPAPTFTNASANITMTAHGLSVNDPVVFSILSTRTTVTITQANPGVISMTNTFAANRPVVFRSTGSLPYGLVAGTTYYVISGGLSGSQFEVSATVGGAAIDTTAAVAGFTNGSANITVTNASTYYKVGQIVRFANSGGGLPTNFAAATDYYIKTVSATQITVAATGDGTAIVAGSAGTGTQTIVQAGTHYCEAAGAMPTFSTAGLLTQGTVYFVKTVVDANNVTLATSAGGTALGTATVASGLPVYSAWTGNDSNNGLAQTRAGAFLTIQKALNTVVALDIGTNQVTIQLCDGVHSDGNNTVNTPWLGSGNVVVLGNRTNIDNCRLTRPSGSGFVINGKGSRLWIDAILISAPAGSACIINAGTLQLGVQGGSTAIEFGACSTQHVQIGSFGDCSAKAAYIISGGASAHVDCLVLSSHNNNASGVTILDTPAFSNAFVVANGGPAHNSWNGTTFTGAATGTRFKAANEGQINSGGGGATFFPGNSAGTGTNPGASPYGNYI